MGGKSTRKLQTRSCLSHGTGLHVGGNTKHRGGSCFIRNASTRLRGKKARAKFAQSFPWPRALSQPDNAVEV